MSALNLNESYPYQAEVEAAFRQLRESLAIARNVSGAVTVYLLYRARFYPLGSPASVASLSLHALTEAIALAKRHSEFGRELPDGEMYITASGYGPGPVITQADTGLSSLFEPIHESPPWLQELQPVAPRPAPRHTVPLARLALPLSVLQQILQLPADYLVKQVAVEEDTLSIYCLTPECRTMEVPASGNPIMHADYRLEDRDGRQWRSLLSVQVESAVL